VRQPRRQSGPIVVVGRGTERCLEPVSLQQLDGGLSHRLQKLRESLVDLQALLGYEIDFPGEDDGPLPPARIAGRLEAVHGQVRSLVAGAASGERLREGASLVLAGRPNAGKSSLFNALLGLDRALVTEVPGTTRDAIEAHTDFLGWPVRLVDTAGLWDSSDRLDRLGVEMSRRYLSAADLVVLCVEAGRETGEDEEAVAATRPTIVVRTKADLRPASEGELAVSAVTGAGLGELRRAAAERVFGDRIVVADLEPGLTRERHRVALTRACTALEEAVPHLGPSGDVVLAAHHVREATSALDELLGVVDVEEVLGRIFAGFCVGK
jgi:tRNA modification GTPase